MYGKKAPMLLRSTKATVSKVAGQAKLEIRDEKNCSQSIVSPCVWSLTTGLKQRATTEFAS
ncbi:hypothetical protein BDD21_3208 [Thiocapsa rosea]|uniref:Uncharacterized protein n=1 Tax=Thiocapsa rosea TaxID=69360 RepID=A0A495V8R9_9GAMM|nr:hypothetical protein BDD21_3208 [Thiocapsa rosea]